MPRKTEAPVQDLPGAGASALAQIDDASRPAAKRMSPPGQTRWGALIFMAPALVLLGAIVLYPLVFSIVRSLFSDGPAGGIGPFDGLSNYEKIFTDTSTLRAVKNNIIWVVVAPTLVTIIGLIFAVLAERIRWASAFKIVLFMPMAISFLATGIAFELIYADQPSRGLANAVSVAVHDTFRASSPYPNLHANQESPVTGSAADGFTTKSAARPGELVLIPMTGLNLQSPPSNAQQATQPSSEGPGLHGVVWNDFKLGGGGATGRIDQGEVGLPDMKIEALQDGRVVATTKADEHGAFAFTDLGDGEYHVRLASSNFDPPFNGLSWLGPNLITPAIIIAYLWVYAGFAMVLLAAGLSSIPRDTLEAARIDGATEWQVFRRITAPLLAPVLLVVFVTLVINVLKVFDIVFVISQGAGANGKYADVLAVSLYNAYGTQRYGLASAIGVVLVLLVVPAMAFNIRRFRRDQQ